MSKYCQDDYYELKFAALLMNGFQVDNPGIFMRVEHNDDKVYFGTKPGEAFLRWDKDYNPAEYFDFCMMERTTNNGRGTSYRTCPSDIITGVIGGYVSFKELCNAFSHVHIVVRGE